jgi:hypothetical protein
MRQSMQFLLPQHVSGTKMPIIRSKISEYLPLLGGHTWKAAWVVPPWASWSVHCSEDVARLAVGHILRAVLTPRKPVRHNPGDFPGMAT